MLTIDNQLNVSLDSILGEICQIFNIKPIDLVSKVRTRELVIYRDVYYYITAFLNKKQGGPTIVGRMVNKDHSTVVHARQKIKDYIETGDKSFVEIFDVYKEKSLIYRKIERYYHNVLHKPMDYDAAIK